MIWLDSTNEKTISQGCLEFLKKVNTNFLNELQTVRQKVKFACRSKDQKTVDKEIRQTIINTIRYRFVTFVEENEQASFLIIYDNADCIPDEWNEEKSIIRNEAEWEKKYRDDKTIFRYYLPKTNTAHEIITSRYQIHCFECPFYYIAVPEMKESTKQEELPEPVETPETKASNLANPCFPVHNLPLENRGFIGREELLEDIHNYFISGADSIQILYGINGIGKTELAKRYAYHYGEEYDAIIWIDGTNAKTMADSLREFFCRKEPELDCATLSDEAVRAKFLRLQCDVRHCLTIIDNVDYIDEDKEKESAKRSLIESYLNSRAGEVLIITPYDADFYGYRRIIVPGFTIQEAERYLNNKTGLGLEEKAKELVRYAGGSPLLCWLYGEYINAHQVGYLKVEYEAEAIIRENWDKILPRLKTTLRAMYAPMLNMLARDNIVSTRARNLLCIYYWLFMDEPEADYLPAKEFKSSAWNFYEERNKKLPSIAICNTSSSDINEATNILQRYSFVRYESGKMTFAPMVRVLMKVLLTIAKYDEREDLGLTDSWSIRRWVGEDILESFSAPIFTKKQKYYILAKAYNMFSDEPRAEHYMQLADAEKY